MSDGRWSPRAAYQALHTYDAEPSPCALVLSENTSPFGAPPAALRVLAESVSHGLAGLVRNNP